MTKLQAPNGKGTIEEMMERLRPMIGISGPPFIAPDAVNAAMIRHWCAAIGDRNPVYTDETLAGQSVYGGIIAPPAMLQVWIMPGFGVAIDFDPVFALRAILDEYGYTSVIATNVEQEYLRPLRIGDRLKLIRTVSALSDEKITPLGRGFFITSRYDLLDQDEKPVAIMLHRSMKFAPKAEGDSRRSAPKANDAASHSHPEPSRVLPVVMQGSERAIGFPGQGCTKLPPTLKPDDLQVGTRLAPLAISTTRSFIVASAIATRDYQEVHHDPDVARARGSRDIFTNILTTTGLIGRLVTDSFGPNAVIRRIAVKLGAPNYAGDRLTLNGTIESIDTEENLSAIAIRISGRNSIGEHVSASATIDIR